MPRSNMREFLNIVNASWDYEELVHLQIDAEKMDEEELYKLYDQEQDNGAWF